MIPRYHRAPSTNAHPTPTLSPDPTPPNERGLTTPQNPISTTPRHIEAIHPWGPNGRGARAGMRVCVCEGEGGLKISHGLCLNSRSVVHFCGRCYWGGQKIGHFFVDVMNVWSPNNCFRNNFRSIFSWGLHRVLTHVSRNLLVPLLILLNFSNDNLVKSCVLNLIAKFVSVPKISDPWLSFLKVVFLTFTVILWESNSPISVTDVLGKLLDRSWHINAWRLFRILVTCPYFDKTVYVIGFTEKYHVFRINFSIQVSDNHKFIMFCIDPSSFWEHLNGLLQFCLDCQYSTTTSFFAIV